MTLNNNVEPTYLPDFAINLDEGGFLFTSEKGDTLPVIKLNDRLVELNSTIVNPGLVLGYSDMTRKELEELTSKLAVGNSNYQKALSQLLGDIVSQDPQRSTIRTEKGINHIYALSDYLPELDGLNLGINIYSFEKSSFYTAFSARWRLESKYKDIATRNLGFNLLTRIENYLK